MSVNSKIKINLDSLKSRRDWRRHKVKDGHNIFRILPPFGDASNGYPYRKWSIIWGLTDPESGRSRPYASSLTSEKRCPVFEYVTLLKERAETIKAKLTATGASDLDAKARLKDLNELISNLSPKTVYVYNAADKGGEVGLLELKSTAHKGMKAMMNQYVHEYNQDPTSLNNADDDSGVWFDVERTGLGRDTEYKVNKCQNKVKNGGSISFVDDRSPLPESVVENYDNLAYDLSSVYQVKSYDELNEILSFNLEGIIKLYPDADLSSDITVDAPAVAATKPTTSRLAATTTKITTKIDDSDDELDDETVVASTAAKTSGARKAAPVSSQIDDDFQNEINSILGD